MLINSLREQVLCDELQLQPQLNRAVEHGDRAYFGLMLSMLGEDVRDQAQFDLIKQGPAEEDISLRDKLQLPQERPLKCQAGDITREAQWDAKDIADIHLQQALYSSPLCHDDSIDGLAPDVANNLGLLTRLKYQAMQSKEALPASEFFDQEVIGTQMHDLLKDFDYDKALKVEYFN